MKAVPSFGSRPKTALSPSFALGFRASDLAGRRFLPALFLLLQLFDQFSMYGLPERFGVHAIPLGDGLQLFRALA
jgi:hypothetical protein